MSRRSVALGLLLLLLAATASADETRLAVIVNAGRSEELNVDTLVQIYLKKRRFWSNGQPIIPVNRDAESATRSAFTRIVFGDQARRLGLYWNRQYFHGVLPPATLASNAAVVRFVAEEPNAIGYVDAGDVDGSVRVVLLLSR